MNGGGGTYFIETKLVFGCKSSLLFHNEVARMLIMIVKLNIGIDYRLSV